MNNTKLTSIKYEDILCKNWLAPKLAELNDEEFSELLKNIKIDGDRRTKHYKEAYSWSIAQLREKRHQGQQELKRDYIHSIQKRFEMDIASCKLMSDDGHAIFLTTNSDGAGRFAIVDSHEKVPEYYRFQLVIQGKYKIMSHDCAKSYSDAGTEIEGDYIEVYQAGMSFIFVIEK